MTRAGEVKQRAPSRIEPTGYSMLLVRGIYFYGGIMHAIARILFRCEHCGKCCKITRAYSQSDVDRIELHTHEPRSVIEEKLDKQVCGYLVNEICSIHLFKPDVCRWYPGPGAMDCPGYKSIIESYSPKDVMHSICGDATLSALYMRCVLNNDSQAAQELLKRLNK